MTAIVGILNKRAAVMAADSAMTVTRGEKTKIYNTATKIFRLSLEHPVGVMMYNSVEFMGTPWDVIFKIYRDRRGKQVFNTLKEYAMNFIDFLNAENYFSSTDSQKDYFISELSRFYYAMKEEVLKEYERRGNGLGEDGEQEIGGEDLLHDILVEQLTSAIPFYEEQGVNPEFEDYTLDNLKSFAHKEFDELMELCEEEQMPSDMRELWEKCFYAYIRSKSYYYGTGIVFEGYGSKDIYPSLIPVYISGTFDHRMRYYVNEEEAASITNDNRSYICPFAQSDVMLTLLKGIAPDFLEKIDETHQESIATTKQRLIDAAVEAGASDDVIAKMKGVELDEIQNTHDEEIMSFIREEYVNGILDAVDSFSIDDMANMAESLISVTNLQRHFSSSDESVGGPIDVAVITRSEGFIWVKHKQWFSQELNPQTRVYE